MIKAFILPAFGKQRENDIRFQKVQNLHLKLKDTPYRANRALALLAKMFSLAVAGKWREDNPITGVEKYSEKALAVLQSVKALTNQKSVFVFPGRPEGEPIKEVKAFWKRVLKEAGLENIRIHDLRYAHASHLVSRGLSLSVVGKLLGHTQASTRQRYAPLADEPLRQAAELFSSKIVIKILQ
jgi:site-specific recombinase XerD